MDGPSEAARSSGSAWLWRGFCPRGDCKKAGSCIFSDPDRDIAREKVANHLWCSTYHNEDNALEWEAALQEADNDAFIVYELGTQKSKKRPAPPVEPQPGRAVQQRSSGPVGQYKSKTVVTRDITVRKGELQQVMDCLDRSLTATEHAATIARSAAKAFEDSAAAISGAKKTLESICMRHVG